MIVFIGKLLILHYSIYFSRKGKPHAVHFHQCRRLLSCLSRFLLYVLNNLELSSRAQYLCILHTRKYHEKESPISHKKKYQLVKGDATKEILHDFPGETLALKEVFGLNRYKITRSPYSSVQSYIIID